MGVKKNNPERFSAIRTQTTVFLADDHAMIREALAALLDAQGDLRVVGQVGNGLDVVPEVLRLDPDVILLDVAMPGIGGLDLCQELTRKCPRCAVLMLTMYDDEEMIVTALKRGACGYLLKEAAACQLAEAVRTVARGEVYLDSGIDREVLNRLEKHLAVRYMLMSLGEKPLRKP